jgi:hypothetical protein
MLVFTPIPGHLGNVGLGDSVMSIWEKLAAATADLSIGTQIGTLIGGGSGHYVKDHNQK